MGHVCSLGTASSHIPAATVWHQQDETSPLVATAPFPFAHLDEGIPALPGSMQTKRGLGRCPPLQHCAGGRTQQGRGCSSPLQSEEGFIKGKRLIIYLAPLHLHFCSSPPSCRLLSHPSLTSFQQGPNGSKRKWGIEGHLTKKGWCTKQLLSCVNASEPSHPWRALQLLWYCCNTAKQGQTVHRFGLYLPVQQA